MSRFYTSAADTVNYVDAINIIKGIISSIKSIVNPLDLLTSSSDFFGNPLPKEYASIREFQVDTVDRPLLAKMMRGVIDATLDVLERQYKKYIDAQDIPMLLREEVESARTHNMDAEEIMGMFSAAKQRAPNATIDFLSCRMRATKNRTLQYLDSQPEEELTKLIQRAIPLGRRQTNQKKSDEKGVTTEILQRLAEKRQERQQAVVEGLAKRLRKEGLAAIMNVPEVNCLEFSEGVVGDILSGRVLGKDAIHIYFEEGAVKAYNTRFMSLKKNVYTVCYWQEGESFDVGEDFTLSKFSIAMDYIFGDLRF